MKIATTQLNNRYTGIVSAIQLLMGEITLWEYDKVPIFDFLYYFKPDLLLAGEEMASPLFKEAVSELTDTKIIWFGDSVPQEFHVDVICAQPNISPLMKKHLEADASKVVYIYDYVDIINSIGGKKDSRLSTKIGSMFSNVNLSLDLLKFLLYVSSVSQLKIIGDNDLSIPSFLGNISNRRKLDFMKSCDIFLDINNSLILEAAANGIFTFSTAPNSLFPVVDIDSFEEKYNRFTNNEDMRNAIASSAKAKVLSSGTNFHRVIEILNNLELENKDKYINKAEEKIDGVLK